MADSNSQPEHHHNRLESGFSTLEKCTCDHSDDPVQNPEALESQLKDLDTRVQALLRDVEAAHMSVTSLAEVVSTTHGADGRGNEWARIKWVKRERERLEAETKRIKVVYGTLVGESLEVRGRVDMRDASAMKHINVEEDVVGVLRVRLEELEDEVGRAGKFIDGMEG